MRLALTILTILLLLYSNAQVSISAGVNRMHEGMNKDLKNYFGRSQQQLYLQDYFGIRVNYLKSNIGFWAEPVFLAGGASISQTKESYTGGGSSPSYLDKYDYYSKCGYNYAALKVGFDYSIHLKKDSSAVSKKWQNRFFFSPNFQLDVLINNKETNHRTVHTTGSPAYYQNQYLGYWNYVEYPATYESFEGISFSTFIFQIGLEIRWRINYYKYFFETGINLSTGPPNVLYRTTLLKGEFSDNQNSILNLSSFIKIGYSW